MVPETSPFLLSYFQLVRKKDLELFLFHLQIFICTFVYCYFATNRVLLGMINRGELDETDM
jgi:hypothetical protein